MRIVRRAVPIVLLALVVGVVAIVLTSRPDLEHARDDVEDRWDAVAPLLDERYALLASATEAVQSTPGPVGELAGAVVEALEEWDATRAGGSVGGQVEVANRLEARSRRLTAAATASPRLAGNTEIAAAFEAAAAAAAAAAGPGEAVAAFNAAVRHYEDERRGPLRETIADLFGYDPVPALDLDPSP
ncbi:MAG: hypothetical protein ACT4OX_00855 [Actinomycetota bacterium]